MLQVKDFYKNVKSAQIENLGGFSVPRHLFHRLLKKGPEAEQFPPNCLTYWFFLLPTKRYGHARTLT
jgi:hypothetical protein